VVNYAVINSIVYIKQAPLGRIPLQAQELRDFIVDKIDDLKGRDVRVLDVSKKSDVTDFLVICSGNSKTHVRGIANHVAIETKHAGLSPLGIEGETDSEWVLVDFGDVVVHVMQDSTRDFYQLEKLWEH
jgi:ribosome-associated protein